MAISSSPVLSIKNLTKVYGNRKAADNVSFDVNRGEIFGFIGPNGAGKSTTIKMITGLAKITSGSVHICGYDIQTQFEKAIANIGGIIENPEMYGYLTGYQNLKFYASLYKGITNERIMEVAQLVGLQKRLNDKVSKYSLGMKQRLGIAQSLLHNPKLIILDEPTNGLDVNGIIEIRQLLKNLAHKRGVAVIISSHILSEIEVLCDKIAFILNGKIEKTQTLEEIRAGYMTKIIYFIKCNFPNYAGKILFDQFKVKCKVAQTNDQIFFNCKPEQLPSLISTLVNKKIMIYGAGKLDQTLEDEFISLVNKKSTGTSIS